MFLMLPWRNLGELFIQLLVHLVANVKFCWKRSLSNSPMDWFFFFKVYKYLFSWQQRGIIKVEVLTS